MADTWPPEPFDIAFARFAELDAWYAGDAATLAEIYTGQSTTATPTHTINGRSYRGGVLGSLSKMFMGQPVVPNEKRMRMHLPLAADLCTLSADLLFGEAPQVVFRRPDTAPAVDAQAGAETEPTKWKHPAQDRLDQIIATDEAHAELLLGGEYAAALGGVFIAVAWDLEISDHVFPKVYAADCAIPVFRHGRLVSVRLWTEYLDGNVVYRLIEEQRKGSISYTLHKGTSKTLGEVVPLTSRTETAHYEGLRNPADVEGVLPEDVPLSVSVGTGTDRLAVVYMPNARPVRDWRKLGQLSALGRSDLDGIQDVLDKVDMAWSSLMRDLENGQGRLIMPEDMLTVNGKPGEGATADIYRQVFTPVGGTLGKASDGSGPMTIVQFAIRVDEHLAIIEALKKEIASAIGYSPSHLGIEQARQGDKTATEVTADLSDSERTRDKKAMYAKAAIARWCLAALEIDKAVFGGEGLGDLTVMPDVDFAPVSQADPEKLARTAQILDAARAASRETIVRTVHPDWDDDEVRIEVKAILAEEERRAAAEPAFDPFPAPDTLNDDEDGADA